MSTDTQEIGKSSIVERGLTVDLSWVLTMRFVRLWLETVAVAGDVAQQWRAPFTLSQFQPPALGKHRLHSRKFIYLFIYYDFAIALVRSSSPCTLRLRRSA